jgi:predicted metal-binding protein/2-polyprenyl-3-methyl-5-hydroxy-6-metoxy-1,4-benzoquinol methylase
MKPLPFLNHDPQETGPQYLENLATGYWFSEVLFTAVELDVFSHLDQAGKSVEEIAKTLDTDTRATERFLQALCSLGLLTRSGRCYYNTKIASDYLVKGKENYQGRSVLWRRYLSTPWRDLKSCLKAGGRVFQPAPEESEQLTDRIRSYIHAMDDIAGVKTREMLPVFSNLSIKGNILDIGAGSGAVSAGFLERFNETKATLVDLPGVLKNTAELLRRRGLEDRVTFLPANILEPWPAHKGTFDLIIISNVLHAYSENEAAHILAEAGKCLKPGGFLLIHDFFLEHCPEKASLFDLNMLINTYNGKVFTGKWVRSRLAGEGLFATGLVPLGSDTAIIVASPEQEQLAGLCLDPVSLLAAKIKDLGFGKVCSISVDTVHVPEWADLRCRFGCGEYGKPHCPPNSPSPARTREVLKDYARALLLEGEPPTGEFQRNVLRAEREAFKAGFHKALAFWAGPCSLCEPCRATGGICHNQRDARPSMEGSGIDVFETVRRAGFSLRTLSRRDDYVKYFALLLLE